MAQRFAVAQSLLGLGRLGVAESVVEIGVQLFAGDNTSVNWTSKRHKCRHASDYRGRGLLPLWRKPMPLR
jgi:hypothetical protein